MNHTILAIVATTVVVSGTAAALLYLRRKKYTKQIEAATEQIEDELQLEDIVSYFRTLNLNSEIDTPFIAQNDSELINKLHKGLISPKPGYHLLMIGVLNKETKKLTNCKFIYSLGWSKKLMEIINSQSIVILE